MKFKEEIFFNQLEKKPQLAFEYLLTELGPPLKSFIAQLVNNDGVDDVIQEVWIKVYKNVFSFRKESKLSTWIYSIARNQCFDHLKKLKRIREKKERKTNIKYYSIDLPDGDEIVKCLNQAIATLPLKQKEVFVLRYFQETPYQEMSNIMNKSVGGLKANYHLACKKIELFIKENYERGI